MNRTIVGWPTIQMSSKTIIPKHLLGSGGAQLLHLRVDALAVS
jgi:hypothetical protein